MEKQGWKRETDRRRERENQRRNTVEVRWRKIQKEISPDGKRDRSFR